MKSTKKGFTLIELLIVIGILAILATTVVLVLNPAQILAETRDTQRISDLGTIKSALDLYLTSAPSPVTQLFYLASTTANSNCTDGSTKNFWSSKAGAANSFSTALTINAADGEDANGRKLDGSGWIPVNLNGTSGGAPIPTLPLDPSNTLTYYYSYTCGFANSVYKLNSNLESVKYQSGGTSDKETGDGGSVVSVYEVGSSLSL